MRANCSLVMVSEVDTPPFLSISQQVWSTVPDLKCHRLAQVSAVPSPVSRYLIECNHFMEVGSELGSVFSKDWWHTSRSGNPIVHVIQMCVEWRLPISRGQTMGYKRLEHSYWIWWPRVNKPRRHKYVHGQNEVGEEKWARFVINQL